MKHSTNQLFCIAMACCLLMLFACNQKQSDSIKNEPKKEETAMTEQSDPKDETVNEQDAKEEKVEESKTEETAKEAAVAEKKDQKTSTEKEAKKAPEVKEKEQTKTVSKKPTVETPKTEKAPPTKDITADKVKTKPPAKESSSTTTTTTTSSTSTKGNIGQPQVSNIPATTTTTTTSTTSTSKEQALEGAMNIADEKPRSTQGAAITFGSGGGFTGAVTTFSILPDGKVVKTNSMKPNESKVVKTLSAGQLAKVKDDLKNAKVNSLNFNHPGNLYFFVSSGSNKLTWGSNDHQIPSEIQKVYDEMMQLVK